MKLATANRKRAWWLLKERAARKRWQKIAKKYSRDTDIRVNAWNEFKHCQDKRLEYDDLVAKIRRKELTATPSKMSDKGIEFLANLEGKRNYAYNDSAGHATFGIGHLIHHGYVTDADRRNWGTPANPSSDEKVYRIFRTDLAKYEAAVREVWRGAPNQPTQAQFDADVSFCFNIGIFGFLTSTHAKLIKRGSPRQECGQAMMKWVKPPEIRRRRELERLLFVNGTYSR